MNKTEAQEKAAELDIKFQENDTVENLKLMIAGKESASVIKNLKAEVKALKDENEAQAGLIAELNEKVSVADVEKQTGTPVISIGGENYQMPIKEMHLSPSLAKELGETSVNRELVKGSAKIQKALLKIKSGFLVKIEEKED